MAKTLVGTLAALVVLASPGRGDSARDLESACYDSTGQAAVDVCTEAILAADPDDHGALGTLFGHRARANLDLKQYDGAISDFTVAINMLHMMADYRDRGTTYALMGKYEEAIGDFTDCIEQHPKVNADCYYGRGLVKKKMGDLEGGDSDIATAKALDPHVDEDD